MVERVVSPGVAGMISIVIPAFNEEKFLPECLASWANQDYQGEYEIIVVDNASTDSTANIARGLGARVVYCPERSVFCARQMGADNACGEIIVQADADTIYPRDYLTRVAECFASHPEAVAIVGRFFYLDPPWWAKIEYFLRDGINRLTNPITGRPPCPSGATLAFRREAFLKFNGYRGILYSPDQYGLARRLSKLGKVLYERRLIALTSSRRVRKSALIVTLEFLPHLLALATYLARERISGWQISAMGIRYRRLGLRLLSSGTLVTFLFLGYGYFIPTSQVFGRVYYRGKPSEKMVALTFDDGPNEPYSSQILDILADYDVKATFFLIGKNVELYPETAKRIVAEGHALGNHSYSHNANHALTEYGAKDLELAQAAIYNTTGVKPHLYRPPHGKKSPWELQKVRSDGLIEVTWSVSSNEPNTGSPLVMAQAIVNRTKPGGIILLHDGYGTAHNSRYSDKSLTVEALPLIIEQLQAKGFQLVTVPELLHVLAYNERTGDKLGESSATDLDIGPDFCESAPCPILFPFAVEPSDSSWDS